MVGAGIVYIDKIIQLFPSKKHFRIQESDTFAAASLSFSFGVMVSAPEREFRVMLTDSDLHCTL
jgi:hypothetical protein